MILNAVERIWEIFFLRLKMKTFKKLRNFSFSSYIKISEFLVLSFCIISPSSSINDVFHTFHSVFPSSFSLRSPSENAQTIALSIITGRKWRTSFEEQRNHVLFASHYAYSFFAAICSNGSFFSSENKYKLNHY